MPQKIITFTTPVSHHEVRTLVHHLQDKVRNSSIYLEYWNRLDYKIGSNGLIVKPRSLKEIDETRVCGIVTSILGYECTGDQYQIKVNFEPHGHSKIYIQDPTDLNRLGLYLMLDVYAKKKLTFLRMGITHKPTGVL